MRWGKTGEVGHWFGHSLQQTTATHGFSFSWYYWVIWQITDNSQALKAYAEPPSPHPPSPMNRKFVFMRHEENMENKGNHHHQLSHGRENASEGVCLHYSFT